MLELDIVSCFNSLKLNISTLFSELALRLIIGESATKKINWQFFRTTDLWYHFVPRGLFVLIQSGSIIFWEITKTRTIWNTFYWCMIFVFFFIVFANRCLVQGYINYYCLLSLLLTKFFDGFSLLLWCPHGIRPKFWTQKETLSMLPLV